MRDEGGAVVMACCCSWLGCDTLATIQVCLYLRVFDDWVGVRDCAANWLEENECVVWITFRMGDEDPAAGILEYRLFILDICDIVIRHLKFEI